MNLRSGEKQAGVRAWKTARLPAPRVSGVWHSTVVRAIPMGLLVLSAWPNAAASKPVSKQAPQVPSARLQ